MEPASRLARAQAIAAYFLPLVRAHGVPAGNTRLGVQARRVSLEGWWLWYWEIAERGGTRRVFDVWSRDMLKLGKVLSLEWTDDEACVIRLEESAVADIARENGITAALPRN